MARKRIGQLPPRYKFALNQYPTERFSKCPNCQKATYPRKFPLLIAVKKDALFVLGKTCKYCSKCEFIIAHQDELDTIMIQMFPQYSLEAIHKHYFIAGTVDKKIWKQSLDSPTSMERLLEHTADIKTYLDLHVEPGGWF